MTTPREEVRWFARQMEQKLAKNDHKDHWTNAEPGYLSRRLRQELAELLRALDQVHWPSPTVEQAGRVIQESADVANFAMMLADNLRKLSGTVVVSHLKAGSHDTGWYYDDESEEGSVGPFGTREGAVSHAESAGYQVVDEDPGVAAPATSPTQEVLQAHALTYCLVVFAERVYGIDARVTTEARAIEAVLAGISARGAGAGAEPIGAGLCKVTGNPCGTDTWAVGYSCNCEHCQAYLRELAAQPRCKGCNARRGTIDESGFCISCRLVRGLLKDMTGDAASDTPTNTELRELNARGFFDSLQADPQAPQEEAEADGLRTVWNAGNWSGYERGKAEVAQKLNEVHAAIGGRAPHAVMETAGCTIEWIEDAKTTIAELRAVVDVARATYSNEADMVTAVLAALAKLEESSL